MLSSATLLQLAFLSESNLHFPQEKNPTWNNMYAQYSPPHLPPSQLTQATKDIPLCIHQRLALLLCDVGRNAFLQSSSWNCHCYTANQHTTLTKCSPVLWKALVRKNAMSGTLSILLPCIWQHRHKVFCYLNQLDMLELQYSHSNLIGFPKHNRGFGLPLCLTVLVTLWMLLC